MGDNMDTLFGLLVLAAVGLGALFLPRVASGRQAQPTPQPTPDTPGFAPPSGTLGIRNNNPFNIRFRGDIQWRGQTGENQGFVTFDNPLNGIRAGMINIHTKMNRDGLTSVRRIITVLSPPNENPTDTFIAFVSRRAGVSPDQPLTFTQHIIPMSRAIIEFENGSNPYSDTLLRQALSATGRST